MAKGNSVMASDAQIEANQANAQKSTGPRTMEGKMKSRRNALKHGLASEGDVLPAREEKKFKERHAKWSAELKLKSDMERYQLELMVFATVQFDCCRQHEMAEIGRRRRVAEDNWEASQEKRIAECLEHWTMRPAECLEQLQEFTAGCEWIMERWAELVDALTDNGIWSFDENRMAMRLLGWPPEMFHEGNAQVAAFRTFMLAAIPEPNCDEVDMFFGMDTSALEPEPRMVACRAKLPSQEFGREALFSTIHAEFDRLEPLRAALWEQEDGPALAEKIDLATFDDSPSGILRRRYQTASQLDMSRSLKRLAELGRMDLVRCEPKPPEPPKPVLKRESEMTPQEREKLLARRKYLQEEKEEMERRYKARNEAKLAAATAGVVTTSVQSASAPASVETVVASAPNQPSGPIGGVAKSMDAYAAALRAADEAKKTT